MQRNIGFSRTLEGIVDDLSKTPALAEAQGNDIMREILNVGRSIVSDVQLDSIIDSRLLACKGANGGEAFAPIRVSQFIQDSHHLSRYQIGPNFSLHVVSWSGANQDPLGIVAGTYTLATLEAGEVFDTRNKMVGIFDFLTAQDAQGTAILVILAAPSDSIS